MTEKLSLISPKVQTVDDALRLQTGAAVKRAQAPDLARHGDIGGALLERVEADDMDAAAAAFLDPRSHTRNPIKPGNGGETILMTQDTRSDYPRLVDTLTASPDLLNAEAARTRLELASKAGVLTLGVDLAETIKARNSIERMLAQQLAGLHSLAMISMGNAQDLLRQYKAMGNPGHSIEAARHSNAAAKLATAFQTGMLALDRVRHGGRQTVKVTYQQVAVAKGGKAVVAGSIKARGPRRKQKGEGRRNAV